MSGMIISTIITLVFTPVYYSVIDEWGQKLSRRFGRKKEELPAAEEA